MRLNKLLKYRYALLGLLFLLITADIHAKKIVYDSPNSKMVTLFKTRGAKYVIRYNHEFKESIIVPSDCEICFKGGSLKGKLSFEETILSGTVRLQGSQLSGTIKNKYFSSEWLCYADGIHDDANNINQMINVCGRITFNKGTYLLSSIHQGPRVENVLDEWQAVAHIGIAKSNVELIGVDDGVTFYTPRRYMTICIYSPPYQFDKTIRNVKIQNIIFRAENNGKDFNQLLHTIRVMGVNGLTIKNCYFDDFYGDAICLHSYGDMPSTGERTRNSNVIIKDNHIKGGLHHSTRNGVSVVNGVNVQIENNLIEETSRKDMPGAIDVEANCLYAGIPAKVIKRDVKWTRENLF